MPKSFLNLWFDGCQAAFDAAVTIERRMSLMGEAAARGTLMSEPEMWRMGPEKLAAFAAGMTAASLAAAQEMQRMSFEPVRASAAVLAAAVKPAHRSVRANARRLGRKPRTK